jgi:hypothetical protein
VRCSQRHSFDRRGAGLRAERERQRETERKRESVSVSVSVQLICYASDSYSRNSGIVLKFLFWFQG